MDNITGAVYQPSNHGAGLGLEQLVPKRKRGPMGQEVYVLYNEWVRHVLLFAQAYDILGAESEPYSSLTRSCLHQRLINAKPTGYGPMLLATMLIVPLCLWQQRQQEWKRYPSKKSSFTNYQLPTTPLKP